MMRLLHESANKEEMHALLKAKQLFTLRPTRSVKFWLRGKTYGEFFSLSIFTCTALQVKKYPTVVFCGEMQMVTNTPIITFVYSGLRKASNSI